MQVCKPTIQTLSLQLHPSLKKCHTLSFFFTTLSKNVIPLSPTSSISLYLQLTHYFGKVAALSKFHTSSRILSLDPSSNYIQFQFCCWKSSFIEEASFEGPGVPLWAIFKQQSAKYFNPSCPRPQNNLNSTKSISRRISRFFGRQCLTC